MVKKLTFLREPRTVDIIGAGYGAGQTILGVQNAPDAMRKAGIKDAMTKLGWQVHDSGNLHNLSEDYSPTSTAASSDNCPDSFYGNRDILNSDIIGAQCEQVFLAVNAAAKEKRFALILGGDHGIATGSIGGMLAEYPDLCVVWIDAHGDCNTPEMSPSKNYHGMPVAHLMGWFQKRAPGFEWLETGGPGGRPLRLNEDHFSIIGLRDLDDLERIRIANSGMSAHSMQNVDREGIAKTIAEALSKIDPKSNRPIHLSFDVDGCDPGIAPATGTKARGGLTYREVLYIANSLHSTGRLVSMDLVEINPALEKDSSANVTVQLGIDLVSCALGKTIL